MIDELKDAGLTDGEIAVYIALLKTGPSTNSPIARQASLQSSTVYYCLNSLIEKGFVSYIQRGNRKQFIPTAPENLVRVMEEKKEKIEEQKEGIQKILPALKKLHKPMEDRTISEVYEGFRGMQMVLNQVIDSLSKGDTYEAFAIEQAIEEPKEMRLFFMRHNKALKAKGIKLNLLAHERMRGIFEKMYGKKFLTAYQEIRYTKELTPVGITIHKNNVITHISDGGKPMSFLVRNPRLAEIYRDYFYSVWKRAKR